MERKLIWTTDDELLNEISLRGFEVNKDKTEIKVVGEFGYTVDGFLSHVHRNYGVSIAHGGMRYFFLKALLRKYPECLLHSQAIDACYGHMLDGGPINAMGCIKVAVHYLRKNLIHTPFRILSIHSVGFRMATDENVIEVKTEIVKYLPK